MAMIAQALVIGVATYASTSIARLPVAVRNDVNEIAGVLRDPRAGEIGHDDVTLLINEQATLAAVRQAMEQAAKSISNDGIFLFYFSGHGDRRTIQAREQSWLLPHDADLDDLTATALSSDEIVSRLAMIGARRQVLMIDACHAGGIGSTKRIAPTPKGFGETGIAALSAGAGRVLLTSSRANEESVILRGASNSVFTTTLLEALGGATIDRGNGLIGVLDIFDYVSQEVPKRADQHPVFHAGDLETNFAIARRGPKPVQKAGRQPTELVNLLAQLYPTGPVQDSLWSRAGGEVSLLVLDGTGVAQWYSALKKIEQGGGGLTLEQLLRVVVTDYPGKKELVDLVGQA